MWHVTSSTEAFSAGAAGTALTTRLSLLRGFELRAGGGIVSLPQTAQRVLAFLALHERPLQRPYVAGSLWPQVPERNADGSLRSTLHRMKDLDPDLVESAFGTVRIGQAVATDVTTLIDGAHHLADDPPARFLAMADAYEAELLPDWYDDWVVEWRERWRQIRFHALEDLARLHVAAGRFGAAIDVGLAAVRAEPLRESAHRVVIEAHLAEGNVDEAIRQYRACERTLRDELGIEPSPRIRSLLPAVMRS